MQQTLLNFLNKLGFLNDDNKVSITNLAVIIFIGITAIRGLFAGAVLTTPYFTWHIESLDISSTLPLLFSLLNYSDKRKALTSTQGTS